MQSKPIVMQNSKEQKREMEELIGEIKTNFRSEINANSKEIKDLIKIKKNII